MIPGDRVTTPDGPGTIIGIDLPESKRARRYIVELDASPYPGFNRVCYFENELREER